MKWPGTAAAYSLIMAIFGQTPAGIHTGLLLITVSTALLTFLLTRRLVGDAAGVVAAGTYALLSISPETLGLAAHATHFVVLPALAGIVLLQNLDDQTSPGRIFGAGVLLGLSVIMKQSGAAFAAFAVFWIAWHEFTQPSRQGRRLVVRLGWLTVGGLVPFTALLATLAAMGVLDRFWLWTVRYAQAYASITTLTDGFSNLSLVVGRQFAIAPGLWSLALVGLPLLFCDASLRRSRPFILAFTVFSVLAICPGWYFRYHYFIQLLPVAGLLAGVAVHAASTWLARFQTPLRATAIPCLLFALAGLWSVYQSRAIFFRLTPAQVCGVVYGLDAFPESVKIGAYLKDHCPPDARIAVVGSEPQIYFYSQRRSATGYIYMYPLLESQPYAASMRQEFIREIEASNPSYVVFVNISTSWSAHPDSNRSIFDWFNHYWPGRFQLIGLAEISPSAATDYRWQENGADLAPKGKNWLAVFKNDRSASSPAKPN